MGAIHYYAKVASTTAVMCSLSLSLCLSVSLCVLVYLPNVSVNVLTVSIELMNLCHKIYHNLLLVLVICFFMWIDL